MRSRRLGYFSVLFVMGVFFLALGAGAQTWQRSSTPFSVAGKTVQGVAVADLNGDGAGDIVLSIDHKAFVYIGDGKGNFKLNADAGKSLASASIQDFILGVFSASGETDLLALASQPSAQTLQLVLYRGDGHGNFDNGTILNNASLPTLDDSCSLTAGSLFKHPAALNDYVLFCNSAPSLVYAGVNAGNGTFTVNTQAAPFRAASMKVFTADLLGKGVDGVVFFDTARIRSNPYASILYFDTPQNATVSTAPFPGAQIARVARYDGEQYPGIVGVDTGTLYSQHGIEGGFGDRKTIDAVAGTVQVIAFGHLQPIPDDPAMDFVLVSGSDYQIQIQPYVNTARTQVVVKQGQKRQRSISMNVKVVPFAGNTIPLVPAETNEAQALSPEQPAAVVGSVGISVDGRTPESVSVDEQGADFSAITSNGTHQTVTSFAGDDVHAASRIAKPMATGTTDDVFISNVSVSGTTVTFTVADSCTSAEGVEHSFTVGISGPETESCTGSDKEGGNASNDTGTCSIASLEGGNYAAQVTETTDSCDSVDTTPTDFSITGAKTTPSISVACSPNNVPFTASGGGTLTTCTATVGATGSTANVTFTSPQISTFSSTSALSGGKASFSGFSPGTAPESFTITATFAGDANFNATSASTTFTVIKATPSISVSCAPNPVAFVASGGGTLTTCTATVGAPGSTAAVSFSENGNVFTSPALSNDTAAASGFSPGTTPQSFTIQASFAGDGNYNAVSATTTFTIVKATPTVTVSCLPSPATFAPSGPTVATCTASVSNGATGSVTFSGTGISSNVALSSGVASLAGFQGFAPTTETVTASYSGDGNNNAASGAGTLTIIQAPQTISFTAPSSPVTFGGSAIGLSATASSGLAVSFSASGPCSISGSSVVISGAGTCTVTASQGGNADFSAAASVSNTIAISQASQTITFTQPTSPVTFGASAIGLSASASSGLAVSFTASGACSVSGSTLSFTGVGTCTVTASQAGNANFSAAASVTNSITVNPVSQAITFTPPTSPVALGVNPITLSATGGASGNPVTFSIVSGPGTLTGNVLNITGAGTITVAANQAGNADFAAAAQVEQSIVVDGAFPTFTQVSPSSSSIAAGQPVTLTTLVNTGGHAPTGSVGFTSNGTSIGSGTVSTVSTTNLLLDSNFEFGSTFWGINTDLPMVSGAAGMLGGNAFVYTGTGAASGFQFNTSAAISVTPGQTYTLSGYIDATSVTSGTPEWAVFNTTLSEGFAGVTVNPGTKGRFSLTFVIPAGITQVVFLCDTANSTVASGGKLIFSNPQLEQAAQVGPYVQTETTAATGSGGSASITTSSLAVGTDSIVADFSGDGSDQASTSLAVPVTVTAVTPTVTVSCSPNPATFASSGLVATCTAEVSGGATGTVTFSGADVVAPNQTLSSGVATFGGFSGIPPGTYTVTATYNGNADNNSASGSTTLTINPSSQTISFAALANQTIGAAPFAVSASASSGLSISFTSTTTTVCTVSGATVTLIAPGTCTIQATQAGNTDFTAAAAVSQTFTVSQVTTSTTLLSNIDPSQAGQSVTFTALVNMSSFQQSEGAAPSGSVSFVNGGTPLGSGAVSTVSTTNVIPDSNLADGSTFWNAGGATPIVAGVGPGGANAFVYTGTGAAAGFQVSDSAPITVTPGATYTLSGFIDATHVTSGNPVWAVFNTAINVEYASATQNTGIKGRVSDTFTVPAGVTQVVVIVDTAEVTVTSGSQLIWSQPQLEEASDQGPYIQSGTTATSGFGGKATFTTTGLPAGTDSMTAVYSGSTNDTGSTSLALAQVVSLAVPTISASCSPNPVLFGGTYSCTATVSGGDSPSGTVTWPAVFGGQMTTLSGGSTSTAVLTVTSPPAQYSGTVTYNGNVSNSAASSTVSLTVSPATPSISISNIPTGNAQFGGSFTATYDYNGNGTPSVSSSTTSVCTASGSLVTFVATGSCTLTASATATADDTAATGTTQTFTVSPLATYTQVSPSNSSITVGQPVTFTSLVNTGGHAPSGTVSFTSNGTSLGSGTVSTATTTNVLTFSDQFNQGNWHLLGGQGASAPTLTANDQVDPFGENTASTLVFPAIPAGENSWIENDTGITSTGIYTMSVWLKANTPTTFTLQLTESNANDAIETEVNVTSTWQRFSLTTGNLDGTAELLWRVLGVVPSSASTLFIYGAQLENAGSVGPYVATGATSASGSGGVATLTTSALSVGTDSIVAAFSGDATDQSSTSSPASVVVAAVTATVSVSCSPNPAIFAPSASDPSVSACIADVSAGATGTVAFSVSDGVGTFNEPLSSGVAVIGGFRGVAPGTYTVTAAYTGDADHSPASASTTLTINPASQTITFTAPTSPVTVGVDPITLSATASSGLPVTFSVISGPGVVSGSNLSITGPGTVVVAANQAGSSDFTAAPQVTQTVVVNDFQLTTLPSSVAIGVVTPYEISLIAGTGVPGSGPFGGAASSAELNGPRDAAVDASGNVYIADLTNNVVEKVSTSGIISIFAGTGTAGFGGDGGPATNAQLNSPQGIALDSAGNVYIADRNNSVIRMVNSSGTISSFAGTSANGFAGDGGPAASAELSDPVDVAFDSAGNLYISDRGNNRIRMVSASTGIITTIAGNGTAGFAGDGGLATSAEFSNLLQDITVDSHGNVFIADAGNNRIRMIAAGTGIISTVAGNGTAGFSGDGGQATSAELSGPFGVAVDAAGNLYLSDEANSRLRMVSTAGTITTIAGGGSAGLSGIGVPAQDSELSGPSGISLAPNGTIYFADLGNNTVRSLGPNGALPFASQPVSSTSAVQTVTVQNIGTAALTFSAAPSVTGDFAIASGNTCGTSGSTLAAGASCSIPVTFSPTDVGSRAGTLTLADNGVATSLQVVLTGTASEDTTTTVTLTSSVNPSTFGQAVVFSAAVPSGATGNVQFLNGATSLGTSSVSGGVATLSTSALPVGMDSITAVYSGDTNFAGATSAAVSQVVQQAIPTISISNIPSPAVFAQSFSPAFTYSGIGSPTESVTSSTTGVCSVSGSTVSFVGIGTCTLTASASATTDDAAAIGSPQTFQVSQVATTTTLSSSLNPSTFGQSVVFTSLVNTGGTTPSGSVAFMNGTTLLGTASVNSVSTTNLIPDSNFVNGVWQFEGRSLASTTLPIVSGAGPGGANAFVLTGNGSPAAFAFNNSPLVSVTPGATYTLSVFIDPSAVTSGTVEAALCTEPGFNCVGNTFVVAGAGQPAQRYSATITIPAGVTQVSVIVDPNQATVSNDGRLIFSQPQLEQAAQEGPYIQTGTAATTGFGGSATFSTTNLPVGTDPITAVYSGDTNDTGSTSPLLQQVVNQVMPTISIANIPSGDVVGQSFTPTFTYSGTGTPTKTATSSTPAVCVVSGGTVSFVAAGMCTLTASATSTTDDTAVTGSSQSFAVGTSAVSIAAVSTLSTSTYGQTVTWTFTVTGVNGTPVVPTGTLQVVLSGTPLTTVPLVNGVGTFTSGTLPGGKDTITTIYSGDANFH